MRLIKICGLTDKAGVDAAVSAGADAVGFVFARSVREIGAEQAAGIARDVPGHVLRVAVMRHPDVELWREVETFFRPDVLQTDAADFEYLDVAPEIMRWPVLREGAAAPAQALAGSFVYEGKVSGRGQRVDWQNAAALARQGRMILAGGLNCENVAEAIEQVLPYGVDVSSAVESAPGVKDSQLIHAFVAAVRAAENRQEC
ncbi:MAG: phosphoribosylanthranilate isomerase [Woeseiaceae bacterium]